MRVDKGAGDVVAAEPDRMPGRHDGPTEERASVAGLLAKWGHPRFVAEAARKRVELREREAAVRDYSALTVAPASPHLRMHELQLLLDHPDQAHDLAMHVKTCEPCQANLEKARKHGSRLSSYPPPCD